MKKASILIIRNGNNEILVGERLPSHRYGPPGGKLEENEEPENAAQRELLEETGLIVKNMNKICEIETPDNWYVYIFEVTEYEGIIENKEPTKCSGWSFISPQKLRELPIVYALHFFC